MTRRTLLLATLLFAVAVAVLGGLTPRNHQDENSGGLTSPGSPGMSPEPPLAFGWVEDPDAVREASAGLPFARFCHTEAFW